jgi:hypothetical protein
MSVWWECSFSVVGPADEVERFRNALPGLGQAPDDGQIWHDAKVKVSNAGFLCVEASRNYGGTSRAEQMVCEFPLLTFVGAISADMDPYRWWTFDGRGGETTWHEFTIEPTADETSPPDPTEEKAMVERLIAESRERLADEQAELAELEAHLGIVERRLGLIGSARSSRQGAAQT